VVVGDVPAAAGEEANILQPIQGLSLITLSQSLTSVPKYLGAPTRLLAQAEEALQAGRPQIILDAASAIRGAIPGVAG
jgi:hypothetical protein